MLEHPRIPHYVVPSQVAGTVTMCRVRTISRKDCREQRRDAGSWPASSRASAVGVFQSRSIRLPRLATTSNRSSSYISTGADVSSSRWHQEVFGCGRISPKPGNPDVLVFAIMSRPKISAHVLPFMRTYMRFSSRKADIELFEDAMHLYELGLHRNSAGLATIVEIAYAMNMNGKQRKRSMDEVLDRILRGHTLNTSTG
jgi:hypothetical protein